MNSKYRQLTKHLIGSVFLFLASHQYAFSNDIDTKNTHNSQFIDANGKKPFSHQLPMTDTELDQFILGRSFFTIPWVAAPSATTARDGLGPHFSANTCVSCHINNGSAPTLSENNQPLRTLVFKLTQPNKHNDRWLINNVDAPFHGSVPDPVYGAQVSIRANSNVLPEAQTRLKVKSIPFSYPDGHVLLLTKFFPHLDKLAYGALHDDTVISLRQPPILGGLGLLEQVSNEDILAWEDPNDSNADGISGRANWLNAPSEGKKVLGRFNWKASADKIISQTANAAASDLGLTNPTHPQELCQSAQKDCLAAPHGDNTPLGSLDLPMLRLQAIAAFIAGHKAPKTVTLDATAQRGKALFDEVGCSRCHRPSFTTPEGIEFHPYTDLLLHDMGEALQDGRPEFMASVREFRTAPLWGVGARVRAKHRFLHDARAFTPEEAIIWHGGEAETAKLKFTKLDQAERLALLYFLEQL